LYNHILYIIDVPYSNNKSQNNKISKKLNLELEDSEEYELSFIEDSNEIELDSDMEEQTENDYDENEVEQVKESVIKEMLISEDNKLNTSVDERKENEFIDIDSEYL